MANQRSKREREPILMPFDPLAVSVRLCRWAFAVVGSGKHPSLDYQHKEYAGPENIVPPLNVCVPSSSPAQRQSICGVNKQAGEEDDRKQGSASPVSDKICGLIRDFLCLVAEWYYLWSVHTSSEKHRNGSFCAACPPRQRQSIPVLTPQPRSRYVAAGKWWGRQEAHGHGSTGWPHPS
jgi:hypothetical protein